MTNEQKRAIDKMQESELRKQSSALNRKDHKAIIEYIDKKLSRLNVSSAMVERSEGDME